jgi:hypothetical protein
MASSCQSLTDYIDEDYNLMISTNVASFFYMTPAGDSANEEATFGTFGKHLGRYCRSTERRRARTLSQVLSRPSVKRWRWSMRRTISASKPSITGELLIEHWRSRDHNCLRRHSSIDRVPPDVFALPFLNPQPNTISNPQPGCGLIFGGKLMRV